MTEVEESEEEDDRGEKRKEKITEKEEKNQERMRIVQPVVSEAGSDSEDNDNNISGLSPSKKPKHDASAIGVSLTPFVGFLGEGGTSRGSLLPSSRIQTLTYPYTSVIKFCQKKCDILLPKINL